jgi:hypothetical protein
VGNPLDHTRANVEVEKTLYEIVEEVVDTVATFDGRFSYTPISPDGRCVLTFSTLTDKVYLTIHARLDEHDQVHISLQWSKENGNVEQHSVAYSGDFNKTFIRHSLGASLADWYARVIRHELDID